MKTGFTKMKRLAAIGLFALSALSFANVKTNGPLDEEMFTKEVHQNKNYFETLQGMFKKGSLPESSKLLGVLWSGRCFEKESPYSPTNAAYHLRRVKNSDVGPLGDDVVLYEAVRIWKRSEAPSYFDKMEFSEFLSKIGKIKYHRVSKRDTSLVIEYETRNGFFVSSRLRTSGKYLVGHAFNVKKDEGHVSELLCYYFLPEYTR